MTKLTSLSLAVTAAPTPKFGESLGAARLGLTDLTACRRYQAKYRAFHRWLLTLTDPHAVQVIRWIPCHDDATQWERTHDELTDMLQGMWWSLDTSTQATISAWWEAYYG